MPRKNLPAPSDAFLDALDYGGSSCVQCACGRVHFCDEDILDYKLEELRRQAKAHPTKYIENSGYTHWGYIGDKQIVVECHCNLAREYEELFWSSRHVIAKYFDSKAKEIQREADDARGITDKVKKAADFS